MEKYLNIGVSVRKVDAVSLAVGEEKFTDDFRTQSPLHTAFLYSPVAHAEIIKVDTSEAEKVPGVADILYYENVPGVLHTTAGQGYPEPSPYDSLLFDRKVRFVGDRVALVAAETRDAALKAVKKIKVEYKELEPLFDFEKAMDKNAPRVHDGDEYAKIPAEYRPEENLAAAIEIGFGDLEKGFASADYIEDHVYKMHYSSHCAIEPHAAVAYFDERGRIVIISTTQVPFHVRRITGALLDIPVGMIRVIKPRIGGGFGGKQEVILEPIAALVAWRNRRPARVVFSRREVFISSRTRHPMRVRMKTGVKEDGTITAMEMEGLMNSGAYGTHALTVLANAGGKVLPLFNKIRNLKFSGKTVYTNLPVGGAYRGYGATQGYFALNQQIDMIARRAGIDTTDFIKKWHIKEGETSEVFKALGEGKEGVSQVVRSCKLDDCIDAGARAVGWKSKRGKRISVGQNRVKGMGVAVAMQGSGIPEIDMAAASMKLNEDGSFNLLVGATDIGTGSDTILAQIAAEVLTVPAEKIIVLSSDTDLTPFDTGAYASSTTYISGAAVEKCARNIKDQLINTASDMLGASKDDLVLQTGKAVDTKTGRKAPFDKISCHSLYIKNQFQIQAQASHTATESPPPFIAQFVEIDVDKKTGEIHVVQFVSAIDCGMPVNPLLVEGQVEGAAVNGLSYALCEEYVFDSKGKMLNPRFWDYKIYTAPDIPEIKTIVVNSYEESGPFGAKSAGEVGINGPAPALANAVYDAVGVRMYETPMTPEKVWTRMKEEGVI